MFSESLRSINESTWLQLQLVYFVSESHEGSNLAPLTKGEKHGDFKHALVVFFCFTCAVFYYKHSINNAQTSNKYVGRKGMRLNCHGLLWAEMAMGRTDQRLLFAAKIVDSQ